MTDRCNREMLAAVEQIRDKCGRQRLTDEELLLLAGEEISRTTTFKELRYCSDQPCPE
ncbi:MAG: hypothetical protein JW863_16415 [Chitinispirillaceae bacterium]|nr:hypothetical protein [Chitinispirillaceae bacterium]